MKRIMSLTAPLEIAPTAEVSILTSEKSNAFYAISNDKQQRFFISSSF